MARLTRLESQAQTRERLLTTAVAHFLAKGYQSVSVEQIAEDAGFSKGAIYSNFENKDELARHVINRVRAERLAELLDMMPAGGSPQDALTKLAEWATDAIGNSPWTMLEIELAARARQRDDLRHDISRGIEESQRFTALAVSTLASRYNIELRDSPENVAAHLLAVGIGLGFQRAFRPTTPLDPLIREIEDLIGGSHGSGGSGGSVLVQDIPD